ncbi:hypothetical protein [Rhizobium sp. BR 314]|uniref:hypothetical protein n=1 Tax=Rhizobium sp. BR 314 TaxID=3040013 RepID=UPI0039BFC371
MSFRVLVRKTYVGFEFGGKRDLDMQFMHFSHKSWAFMTTLRHLAVIDRDLERAEQAEVRLAKLETENTALREENAELRLENARLKAENQLLRDQIARLKNLPPRLPFRPSGMEKATDGANDKSASKKKPRGPKLDAERVSREEICAPVFRQVPCHSSAPASQQSKAEKMEEPRPA